MRLLLVFNSNALSCLPDTCVLRQIQHGFYDDYFLNFPLNAKKPHHLGTISLYDRYCNLIIRVILGPTN